MGEKELKELLLERLHLELNLFKDSMLQKEKKDIYKDSYKIEAFVNIYEIFLETVDGLGMDEVRRLLYWKYGILESLYQEWLTKDDGSYEELKAYVNDEVRTLARPEDGKEEADGAEFSQAA